MSYTEINQQKGMPFGGMPYDRILYKLEETDPELVDEVRGNDQFHDIEDDYDQYARGEIIDWTPDTTFLESDHPRRDPAISRSILNLRYNGTRGSQYELPQHPELFLGFTGNDPRGRDTGTPRFDKYRAQIEARARNLEVRMGHNVGHDGSHQESERPWTGPAQRFARQEIQRRLKNRLNIFAVQKEGRPWGRSTVADEQYGLRQRLAQFEVGDEGIFIPQQDQPRFVGYGGSVSGYDPAIEGIAGARRRDARRNERAPWTNTTGDSDLAVQRYGRAPLGVHVDGRMAGAAAASAARPDAELGQQREARAANRQTLAESMSAAASHRRALTREGQAEAQFGAGRDGRQLGKSAPALAQDVARVYREVRQDQAYRAAGTIQDHEGGVLGPSAGLGAPSADPQGGTRATATAGMTQAPTAHETLAKVDMVVRAMGAASATDRGRARHQIEASGKRGTATGEVETMTTRGATPSGDPRAALNASEAPLARAAAAAALEVHSYRGATPVDHRWAGEGATLGGALWDGRNGRKEGKSGVPEFRGHSQVANVHRYEHSPGLDARDVELGGLAMGTKDIRPGTGSDDTLWTRDADGLEAWA